MLLASLLRPSHKAGIRDVAGLPFVRAPVPIGADIFAMEGAVGVAEVAVSGVDAAVALAAAGQV